jgi:hypothetical protein
LIVSEHFNAQMVTMAVKTARIIIGAYAVGGPRFLTSEDVARIDTRPDEHYRQRVLAQGKTAVVKTKTEK